MFLTQEDPRARVKGSRDPLGVQVVWAAFGRHVVTNLTTVTQSVRDFTVLMLGRYFATRFLEQGRIGEDQVLDVFLRCEQIGAYARHVVHDVQSEIRGIERVIRNVREGGGKVFIDVGARGRILSDQKTYGLWGLYTVSSRVSGLLDAANRPTPGAAVHLEETLLPRLGAARAQIERLLLDGGPLATRRNDPVLAAFARCLGNEYDEGERAFYSAYLRDGDHVSGLAVRGRQARFRELLERHGRLEDDVGRKELERLASLARREDEGLAQRLRRILALEALLAPAEALFDHLQVRHGQRPAAVAREVSNYWGGSLPHLLPRDFEELRSEIEAHVETAQVSAMGRAYDALAAGEHEGAIEALLDWNRLVMAGRDAAPWLRMGDDGRLDVRYRGIETSLPAGDELATLWNNPYFIASLKAIARQLAEVEA